MNRLEALNEIIAHTSRKRTICEVWRELFFMCNELEDQELAKRFQAIILDGFIMGKSMSDRLFKYKADWDKGLFPENTDFESDMKTRQDFLDEIHKG